MSSHKGRGGGRQHMHTCVYTCLVYYQVLRVYSYRLCELLYEKKRQFGKVLSCYLRDKHRIVSLSCIDLYTVL